MKLQKRKKDIILNKENLEHLYTFKDFPVFMGCVTSEKNEDLKSDMRWEISLDSGVIQLSSLIPIDIVYNQAHNSGLVGSVWMRHHTEFANFIIKRLPLEAEVLEIGAQHGILADKILSESKKIKHWTIVEPNPNMIDSLKSYKNVIVDKAWFDEDYKPTKRFNVIIHSHVLEHILEPHGFIKSISDRLREKQMCIFSIPNMKAMLEKKYTNCLNFEHTFYLSEEYVDYMTKKHGLVVVDKEYFKNDHSIFYCVRKNTNKDASNLVSLSSLYDKNKSLFSLYIKSLTNQVTEINKQIAENKNIYLFGAHVFSQYLINLGLDITNVLNVLDNDPNKQAKRLYGTNLTVVSPEILEYKKDAIIILKAGAYTEEIKNQIKKINSHVRFIL